MTFQYIEEREINDLPAAIVVKINRLNLDQAHQLIKFIRYEHIRVYIIDYHRRRRIEVSRSMKYPDTLNDITPTTLMLADYLIFTKHLDVLRCSRYGLTKYEVVRFHPILVTHDPS